MTRKQKRLFEVGPLRSFVRKVIYPVLKLLPRKLKVTARIIRALFQGEIRLTGARNRLQTDTFEVEFSDNLQTIHARCGGYYGWKLDREQTPALAYHSATGVLKNLGVLSPGLFDPKAYVFHFRGIELQYFTGSSVWPPSFSSFILAANLIDSWSQSDQIIWDVGCGAGVIGLLIKSLAVCREVYLTDIDLKAIELARFNADRIGLEFLNFRVESFPPPIRPAKIYDLIVSNPPWFPPKFMISEAFEHPTLDDLPLMKALMQNGLDWAKRVVFGFPGIMHEEIMHNLRQLNLSRIKWQILDKKRLPIPERLIGNEKPRELPNGVFLTGPSEDFDLWHDFYICELRRT